MKKLFFVITILLLAVIITPVSCKAPSAQFEVISLDVTPSEAAVGETVNVTAEVRNAGGNEGAYRAVLTVNGTEVERKDITLAPGASKVVTFSLVKDAPGSYQVAVGGLSSTLIVEGIAKIEIGFNPNPVACKDGHWHWRVILTEVNGIGVKLNKLTTEIYQSKRLLDTRDYDSSSIQKWLDSAYLPAYGSADFGAGFPCQAITHEVVTVTGIDDNGHEITATGRVDFLPQVELKYDDGEPEGSWAIGGPGRGYLAQFSPPSRPFTINEVKIFGRLYGTGYERQTFIIQVWDEDLKETYSASYPHTKFSLTPGWVEIDMPDVIVDDNFYIHICTNTPKEGGIQISYDSSISNEHSEVTQNWAIADWYLKTPKEKVNWMIRVVGSITVPITGTPTPSETETVAETFMQALSEGDIDTCLSLISDDVVFRQDPPGITMEGKAQFEAGLRESMAWHAQFSIATPVKVEEEKVTFSAKVSNDQIRIIGMEHMNVNVEFLIPNGKIISWLVTPSPEDWERLTELTAGGVGFKAEFVEEGIKVKEIPEDSPAYEAGLRVSDVIIAIDRVSYSQMREGEALLRLKGSIGSKVQLSVVREGVVTPIDIETTRVDISQLHWRQLAGTIKGELAKGLTDEELKELVVRLGITREDLNQLAKELTREEYDELLWGMKWAQEPPPEHTNHRVDNPGKYDVQGLRVNADFEIDLSSWYDNVGSGTYWVPAARLGTPGNTIDELLKLKRQPEKAKTEINNLFEALAFMHLCLAGSSGNVKREERNITWEFPKPSELAIADGTANCAAAANCIYYLLEDDYDEVGCVWRHSSFEAEHFGGHCTSYIKESGKYYFFDPVSLVEARSHYPVEDGDGTGYHCDGSDRIIQSTARNYVMLWSQLSADDEAIFAMWPGPGFAIGNKGNEFYYPEAFDDSNLAIWKDAADSIELVKASFSPAPPEEYLGYEPYKDYSEVSASEEAEPHVETMPSDG